jgi:hypothetical protein
MATQFDEASPDYPAVEVRALVRLNRAGLETS